MNWVKLKTHAYGFDVWVNLTTVSEMMAKPGGGTVLAYTDAVKLEVQESPDQIFAMVSR